MPQLQNLVLTDRATTPVNHTFAPRDITGGVGAVVESSGVPVGDSRYTIGLRQTASKKYVGTIRLAVPVVQNQTINGVTTPVVVRTGFADATFTFDSTSSEQERKDLVGMFASSLDTSKVLVNDTLVKLQGVY